MNKELVILLHGIGHSRWNMMAMELALRSQGYDTLNITYPSRRYSIEDLTDWLAARMDEDAKVKAARKIHFVTHSMGGILARSYLDKNKDLLKDRLGRVVMIAPPNGGSEVADLLKSFPPYQWLFGPAGQQLTTTARKSGPLPFYPAGIIAGNAGWPYILGNLTIKGDHDGRVAVERTRLDGMKDHMTVKATHSFISWKPDVHRQVIHFLKHEAFSHA